MFAERFGLNADPFRITADPSFLYFGQGHKDALSAVYLSVLESRGLSLHKADQIAQQRGFSHARQGGERPKAAALQHADGHP